MPSKVRFGRFEFDPASGDLSHDGRRVRLQRQPSRLLELLLAKPGDVVAREEIRLALWGEDTHVDFERSLNFCVARLRSALCDSASEPTFIETLPTRGYRFIAPVLTGPVASGPATVEIPSGSAASPAAPPSPLSRRWPWLVVGAAVALAGIAVAVWPVREGVTSFGSPKVVVVPFQNETGVPDLDRVAKGVSDATVARLAAPERLAQLQVIGNAAGLRMSFRPSDMKATGDSLGAQYLVLGQMKKDDRRLRIVAHLIRVSDQTHVWAKTYDTDALDLPQQASIAEEIAAAVAVNVGKG
jgi:TolB-like protein/DNA-binding winged helix-turn-helix (wHTH) protein